MCVLWVLKHFFILFTSTYTNNFKSVMNAQKRLAAKDFVACTRLDRQSYE